MKTPFVVITNPALPGELEMDRRHQRLNHATLITTRLLVPP